MVKQIWYDLDNPEEAKIAKEVSPVFQIDKIKKPLFVVQGANDPRVNINESDQIVKGLRAKGFDVPYMVKYDEGHGFGKRTKTELSFIPICWASLQRILINKSNNKETKSICFSFLWLYGLLNTEI